MTRSSLLTAGAMLTFSVAMLIVVFGVVASSGVYGSRMAWLLGIALPLLVATVLLARTAARSTARAHGGPSPSPGRHPGSGFGARMVLVASVVLLGIPVALAGALLSVYALFFVAHGVSLLR